MEGTGTGRIHTMAHGDLWSRAESPVKFTVYLPISGMHIIIINAFRVGTWKETGDNGTEIGIIVKIAARTTAKITVRNTARTVTITAETEIDKGKARGTSLFFKRIFPLPG